MLNNEIEIYIHNNYKTLNELGSLLEDISKNTTAKTLDLGDIPFNLLTLRKIDKIRTNVVKGEKIKKLKYG